MRVFDCCVWVSSLSQVLVVGVGNLVASRSFVSHRRHVWRGLVPIVETLVLLTVNCLLPASTLSSLMGEDGLTGLSDSARRARSPDDPE
eukprot:7102566-Prymnesium_polylepis.2